MTTPNDGAHHEAEATPLGLGGARSPQQVYTAHHTLRANEIRVMAVIATEEVTPTFDVITSVAGVSRRDVKPILTRLSDCNFVERRGGAWTLTVAGKARFTSWARTPRGRDEVTRMGYTVE